MYDSDWYPTDVPQQSLTTAGKNIYTFAIIGGGPKGMFALDRLIANLDTLESRPPISITIFNNTKYFGSGDVYRSDQPEYLRMNIGYREIDMWFRKSIASLVTSRPNFEDWLALKNIEIDHNVEFPPRALVGEYLEEGFYKICDAAPENIKIYKIEEEVIDIERDQTGYRLFTNNGRYHKLFSDLILTTGHAGAGTQCTPTARYTPMIYPVSNLKNVEPQSVVAVKGMALTFVDAILAITEGRGGTFVRRNGKLSYIASGYEPAKIYPFSRTGLPMIPRRLGKVKNLALHYFTEEAVDLSRPVDFEHDILPLIKREITLVYYNILFEQHGYIPDGFIYSSFSALKEEIDAFHLAHTSVKRFDVEQFLYPLAAMQIDSPLKLGQWIASYIGQCIEDLEDNRYATVITAAQQVWSAATPLFRKIYKRGGLSPASHQKFMFEQCGDMARVAYGPPLINMEKILAITEAHIVDFAFANAQIEESDQGYRLISPFGAEACVQIDHLINARIPKYNIMEADGLYARLLERKMIRPYVNVSDNGVFQPGCAEIDDDGHVVDANGEVNTDILLYGTPTEGITFDNDALIPDTNDFISLWATRLKDKIHGYAIGDR